MRTVFPNREIPHLWAHATQDHARGSNVFFRGAVIYSYGEHFPMGIRFTGKGKAPVFVLTDERYSSTTAKHQSYVRQAVYGTVLYVPNLRGINPDTTPEEIARTVKGAVSSMLDRALKMKKTEPRYKLAEQANRYHEAMLQLGAALGKANKFSKIMDSIRAKRDRALDGVMAYREKLAAAYLKAQATRAENYKNRDAIRAEKERVAREKWAVEKPAAIETWRNGGILDQRLVTRWGSQGDESTMLRLSSDGKEIETSQGARFPVEHAIKLFPLWRTLVSHKREYKRNGHTIHLGPYALDSIDSEGNIKAGCHNIKRLEVEHIARVLGLMP